MTVVYDLRARGVVHAGPDVRPSTAETDARHQHSCACRFLQRHAAVIRDRYGGLVLAFLDVFGGYESGARPLLELSLRLRLIEPSAGAMVTFAASDRRGRLQGQTLAQVRHTVMRDVQRLIRDAAGVDEILDCPEHVNLTYQTMQVYGWHVQAP